MNQVIPTLTLLRFMAFHRSKCLIHLEYESRPESRPLFIFSGLRPVKPSLQETSLYSDFGNERLPVLKRDNLRPSVPPHRIGTATNREFGLRVAYV